MNWIEVKDKKPICYKIGDWDGRKSDNVLCMDINDEYHITHCYEGTMDGSYFYEWFDKDDWTLDAEVTRWCKIE